MIIFSNMIAILRTAFVTISAVGMLVAAGYAQAAEAKGKTFASPQEAVKAIVAAAGDQQAVLAILGPEAKPLISSGDAAQDKADRERFLKSYREKNRLVPWGDDAMLLVVGKDEWIFPIPIVKEGSGWRFDTKEGAEEVLNRRIGRNELAVIQAVQAYVDAQREYYLRNPQNDKLLQYAQRFMSTKGKRDGLYFPVKEGEKASPLGPLFERVLAARQGEAGKRIPYHGYYYRILRSQGPDAQGGAYNYLAQGRMIGGHALVAWPASYGNSGIMTFIVSHAGVVYEKDLGKDTASAVQKITRFNPDKSWKRP